MKFVKLHNKGVEILVNMRSVSAVYRDLESESSVLIYNIAGNNGGREVKMLVDESLDEIYAKANGNGE